MIWYSVAEMPDAVIETTGGVNPVWSRTEVR